MKKSFYSVSLLAIVLVCTFLSACRAENPEIDWKDIPVYPGAELITARSWMELPAEEPWSEVQWRYYLVEDKNILDDVVSFYDAGMPEQGWQDIPALELEAIEDFLWDYLGKIDVYIPADIAGILASWDFYKNNDKNEWAAVWTGINNQPVIADGIYIVVMQAK